MLKSTVLVLLPLLAACAASGVTLFEFTNTSKPWKVTNDPVMGGVSYSTFTVVDGVGFWSGEVKDVPKLKAPGTCQSEAGKFASVDCSDFDAIEINLVSKGALKQFQASWTGPFVPEPAHSPRYRRNAYKAMFNVSSTGAPETLIVPMAAFTSSYSDYTGDCKDHGAVCCSPQHPEVCPSQKTKSSITDFGIDAQGTLGKFELYITSIRAMHQRLRKLVSKAREPHLLKPAFK
jgi:hypothetical protein